MTSAAHLLEPLIIDRAAERRELVDLTACAAVIVRDGTLLTADGHIVELPPREHPDAELAIYLGQEGDSDLVALVPRDPAWSGRGDDGIGSEAMTGLRDLIHLTAARGADGARDREIAATAVALSTWHANHPRCSVCGDPTVPTMGGWVRRCERDQRDHYPRTDPAVIVAITDEQDRLLMAHASYWSPGRFSHLAGYVEPGESLEQAVMREVYEEAKLTVSNPTYIGSQPWPFPASIMVGFRATVDDPTIEVDGVEITEAAFFTRDEYAAALADRTLIPAPLGSIARRMVDDWFEVRL